MDNENKSTTSSQLDPTSYGLESIDVQLDNKDGVLLAGETLTGKVILRLARPIDALGIRIRCKGEAKVHFTDRSRGIRRKYNAEEAYIHLEPYLSGDGRTRMQVTTSEYTFKLNLPENTPCSFEGLYGRVRYTLRATLIIDEGIEFHSSVLPFTLNSKCDLNRDDLAPLPISETQSKTFIGQKEPLTMSLQLPVRGFVSGQTVPMKIDLRNESNVRVSKVRIVLKKVVMYHAREKSRRHKEIVVEIELPVERKEETMREYFDVPSIPPSGMQHCSIIDVRYSLKVEACVDLGEWYYRMLQKNLKIRTSIIVGSVPLENYEVELVENGSNSIVANGLPTRLSTEETYEKSQIYRSSKPDKDDPTGEEFNSDGEIEESYSPLYRVYKFEKTTPN